jgi:hypothetical protein
VLAEGSPRGEGNKKWLFRHFDTGGEVIFATASTPTHLVFNSLPNMNCAYFRLRQQYPFW